MICLALYLIAISVSSQRFLLEEKIRKYSFVITFCLFTRFVCAARRWCRFPMVRWPLGGARFITGILIPQACQLTFSVDFARPCVLLFLPQSPIFEKTKCAKNGFSGALVYSNFCPHHWKSIFFVTVSTVAHTKRRNKNQKVCLVAVPYLLSSFTNLHRRVERLWSKWKWRHQRQRQRHRHRRRIWNQFGARHSRQPGGFVRYTHRQR